ncbi:LytTR family transcriptional regulator DNA-binding domain-containing protein [Pseudomonas sp. Marseille-Q5115]|uniref:LytTR family transcriptional regulator DNA-binding domain-containing protein n=1 Tax=Pseudomonas sp. Marseille-Q5115 TaxID=2866593 RepID=UPI001CE494AC
MSDIPYIRYAGIIAATTLEINLCLPISQAKSLPDRLDETYYGQVRRSVALADVTHFRAADKYAHACHPGGEVTLYPKLGCLNDIGVMLVASFVRIHRNTLVRLSCIESILYRDSAYAVRLRGTGEQLGDARRHGAHVRALLKPHSVRRVYTIYKIYT